MNAKEPLDLAKMSIIVLLLCLTISATAGFFYYLYDTTDERVNTMEQATLSAPMEKLFQLEDQSSSGNYPLVTNVVSALTEFQESDLLYITVKGSPSVTYTYSGVNLTTISGNEINQSAIPVTAAAKALLPYSDSRCILKLVHVDADGYAVTSGGMTGIEIYPFIGGAP